MRISVIFRILLMSLINWLFFRVLLTRKHAYMVLKQRATFLKLFMINKTLNKVRNLSFKQKGNNKTIYLFYLQFVYFLHNS